mgnify:CR=1 FL=1
MPIGQERLLPTHLGKGALLLVEQRGTPVVGTFELLPELVKLLALVLDLAVTLLAFARAVSSMPLA